jgi:hypothetical protein
MLNVEMVGKCSDYVARCAFEIFLALYLLNTGIEAETQVYCNYEYTHIYTRKAMENVRNE